MSIVPIRGKWKVVVKKVDGTNRTIEIDQVNYNPSQCCEYRCVTFTAGRNRSKVVQHCEA